MVVPPFDPDLKLSWGFRMPPSLKIFVRCCYQFLILFSEFIKATKIKKTRTVSDLTEFHKN